MKDDLVLSVGESLSGARKERQYDTAGYEIVGNCEVRRGSIVGLFGRSGVGKTRLARLLVDLVHDEKRPSIRYLPQELPLFPELSVRANVDALSGGLRLDEVLRYAPHLRARLKGRERWSPATLSGGEKRLLVLLAGACSAPDLLVIDETLVSLDDSRLRWALQFLRAKVDAGVVGAVLIVSHDSRVLAQCDHLLRLSERTGRRYLEVSATEAPPSETYPQEPVPLDESQLSKPKRLSFMARLLAGAFFAIVLLLLVLISPRYWASQQVATVIPTLRDVAEVMAAEWAVIARAARWSTESAIIALVCSVLLSLAFWMVTSMSSSARWLASSTWTALQSVPVILFSPLVVIVLQYRGRGLEVAIATFIAVFPLGLIGARALATTPEDFFRAHGATNWWRRFTVAVRFVVGDLARGFIACSPLPAVGVVVAEYLIRERGLGRLVNHALTNRLVYDAVYAYVIACVLLALSMVFLASAATLLFLPRDVAAD